MMDVDGHQSGCRKERRDPLSRNHRGEYECDCVVGWITDRLQALDKPAKPVVKS